MTASDLIPLAKIGGAHGLKGDVRVRFFSDDPAGCCTRAFFDQGGREFRCVSFRAGKTMDVAHFEGIDTREGAEALAGSLLYQPRAGFAPAGEDEYYYADLIGLSVLRASDRRPCGTVSDVFQSGASDILTVRAREEGRPAIYLPFTHAALPVVDIQKGIILAEDSYLE